MDESSKNKAYLERLAGSEFFKFETVYQATDKMSALGRCFGLKSTSSASKEIRALRYTLEAAVALALDHEREWGFVVVLYGNQGCGKNRAIEALRPTHSNVPMIHETWEMGSQNIVAGENLSKVYVETSNIDRRYLDYKQDTWPLVIADGEQCDHGDIALGVNIFWAAAMYLWQARGDDDEGRWDDLKRSAEILTSEFDRGF